MFQFRRFPSYTYLIQYRIPCGGFPHSEISGSKFICNSPKLIAAYHVLHRLLMPRHSPCALISLTCRRSTPSTFRKTENLFCSLLGGISSSNSNLLALGFEFVGDALCKVRLRLNLVTSRIIHVYLVSLVRIMQAHLKEVSLAKIVIITLLIKKVFLYCCLLIIASIIHNVQFSRCMFELLFQETQWNLKFLWDFSQSLLCGGD